MALKILTACNGREVFEQKTFSACGSFGAFNKAEEYLEDLGFTTGLLCDNEPVGFAPKAKFSIIAKWKNIDPKDWDKLSGIMVSDDFREGDVTIVRFKE